MNLPNRKDKAFVFEVSLSTYIFPHLPITHSIIQNLHRQLQLFRSLLFLYLSSTLEQKIINLTNMYVCTLYITTVTLVSSVVTYQVLLNNLMLLNSIYPLGCPNSSSSIFKVLQNSEIICFDLVPFSFLYVERNMMKGQLCKNCKEVVIVE